MSRAGFHWEYQSMNTIDDPIQTAALRRLLAEHSVPCPACGYNLRGLQELRCPECGLGITEDALQLPKRQRRKWRSLSGGVALALAGCLALMWPATFASINRSTDAQAALVVFPVFGIFGIGVCVWILHVGTMPFIGHQGWSLMHALAVVLSIPATILAAILDYLLLFVP